MFFFHQIPKILMGKVFLSASLEVIWPFQMTFVDFLGTKNVDFGEEYP